MARRITGGNDLAQLLMILEDRRRSQASEDAKLRMQQMMMEQKAKQEKLNGIISLIGQTEDAGEKKRLTNLLYQMMGIPMAKEKAAPTPAAEGGPAVEKAMNKVDQGVKEILQKAYGKKTGEKIHKTAKTAYKAQQYANPVTAPWQAFKDLYAYGPTIAAGAENWWDRITRPDQEGGGGGLGQIDPFSAAQGLNAEDMPLPEDVVIPEFSEGYKNMPLF